MESKLMKLNVERPLDCIYIWAEAKFSTITLQRLNYPTDTIVRTEIPDKIMNQFLYAERRYFKMQKIIEKFYKKEN